MTTRNTPVLTGLLGFALVTLAGCGGGSGASGDITSNNFATSSSSSVAATGNLQLLVSDGSDEDWATIGVKILGITLAPQGGGTPVSVYASTSPLTLNLAQLDQLGEILGSVSVPAGTYVGATLTLGANPGDIVLTASADPSAGFSGTAGATVPASQIQIQHTQGTAPNLTVATRVTFDSPLVVAAGQSNALDLEVDLGHPAFIVAHVPPAGAGNTVWAVNFDGPIRPHRVDDLTRLVLRHAYGTVSSVAANNTSISIAKVLPAVPAVSPETASPNGQTLQILADAANGTLFYDLDAKTNTTIRDFSSVSSGLAGRYVRVAARYQQDGSLVATRIWASGSFNSVWISPEGHVLHVDTANNIIQVARESGGSVPLTVNAGTKFYFRAPASGAADSTPIATGTAFLASGNLVRGFKVHASVVDPLATPLVAQSVDIETATYEGRISGASPTGFTFTRRFSSAADNYTHALNYIAATSANGKDASGNALAGFKWWNFAFPTLVNSGPGATTSFQAAAGGSVDFGGSAGSVFAKGVSFATWGDAANAGGWSAPWTVLTPAPLPLGTVAIGLVNNAFTMTVPNGTQAATISVSTAVGAATLVYQVDRTGGVVTVSTVDISTPAGLTTLTSNLQGGVPVKVFGVPGSDGTFKAYVLSYYTGTTKSIS